MVFGELHLLPLSDLTESAQANTTSLRGRAGAGCKHSEREGEKSVSSSIMKCLLNERKGDTVVKKSHSSIQYVASRASRFHCV